MTVVQLRGVGSLGGEWEERGRREGGGEDKGEEGEERNI